MPDTVASAHTALEAAEAKIAAAQRARDEAHANLEHALAAHGWTRMRGAFSAGATPLYTHALFPTAHLRLEQVLAILEQQKAAIA